MKKIVLIPLCIVGILTIRALCNKSSDSTPAVSDVKNPKSDLMQYQKDIAPAPTITINDSINNGSMYSDTFVDSLVDAFIHALKSQLSSSSLKEPDVQLVLNKIGFYRKFLKENFKNAKGLHIDAIGNFHWNTNLGKDIPDEVYKSQKEVRKILDYYQYSLVGWEMSASDSVTPESIQQEQEESQHRKDPADQRTVNSVYSLKSSDVADDAVFAYWLDNLGQAKIIGWESRELWYFYNSTLSETAQLLMDTRSFVSYVALAKVINSMNTHHYKNAVIVSGSYHSKDFILLARKFGIVMRGFDACHDNTFNQPTVQSPHTQGISGKEQTMYMGTDGLRPYKNITGHQRFDSAHKECVTITFVGNDFSAEIVNYNTNGKKVGTRKMLFTFEQKHSNDRLDIYLYPWSDSEESGKFFTSRILSAVLGE